MGFVLEPRGYADPDVVTMVAEVQQEYVARYGGPDDAVVEPADFVLPTGLFLVGLLDGVPVATGAWRRLDGDTAEIKRMYVRAAARRQGLARLVLAEVERTALAAGVDSLVLNTGVHQPEAVALYLSAGYTPSEGFGHYAHAPDALFYRRSLR